jgi:hypothetical protein
MRDGCVDLLGHLYDALIAAGATAACVQIQEDLAVALPETISDRVRGGALYDLACLYCRDGRMQDGAATLDEAVRLHPALMDVAVGDPDLSPLRQTV